MSEQRIAELVEQARRLLETKGAAMIMLADTEDRLALVRDELLELGVKAGDTFALRGGDVELEQGAVTTRRAADTGWLDDHYEELPDAARALVDIREIARLDLSDPDFPEEFVADVRNRAVEVKVTKKWPTVAELEELLPAEMADLAIVRQVRGKPVLVFKQRGVAIGQDKKRGGT